MNFSEKTRRVFIGLGSNLGDPRENLEWAFLRLESLLDDMERSSLYVTEPRDDDHQPQFLNACVSGYPRLSPEETLARLLELEKERGRIREPDRPKGPRVLDLDILLWGEEIITAESLTVPHPRLCQRQFVLIPLLEIAPFLTHPATGQSLYSCLKSLEPQGVYFAPETFREPSGPAGSSGS